MRRLILLTFLLVVMGLAAAPAHAQFTAVTAQVKDPTGQLYTSCQVSAAFVPSPSATTQPFINGGLFPTVVPVFACDSSANFSLTLADNNQVSDGRGGGPVSQWRFSICSAPGKYPGPQYCFAYTGIITGATLNLTVPIQAVAANLPTQGGSAGNGIPFLGPDPWYDVTNSAYGSCPFNGTGDDTSCWNAALAAQAATITANGGGGGHIYLPCGVNSSVSSSLATNNNAFTNGWTLIDLCGTLYPTGTITLAHGEKGFIGHPQGTGAFPSGSHIPYTLINTSKFVGTGPVIAIPSSTDANDAYFDSIGITQCPGDCLQLGASITNQPVFDTIRNSTFTVSSTSTGAGVDSFLGFGLDISDSFFGGMGHAHSGIVLHGTGMVDVWDTFFLNTGIDYLTDYCPAGAVGTSAFWNLKTEALQNDSSLVELNTTGSCQFQGLTIGPNIYMADNMGSGGLYLINHTGNSNAVTVQLHGINPFTGFQTSATNGPSITELVDGDTGIQLNEGMSISAAGDKNIFGSCPGGTPSTTNIALTLCNAGSSGGGASPLVQQIVANIPTSVDGAIQNIYDRGNTAGAIGGWCTSRTFGGYCGSSGTGHPYGLFWRDVSTGGFGVFRSEGITASAQRNWIFPDADTNVAGYNLAQTWSAKQTFGAMAFTSVSSGSPSSSLCIDSGNNVIALSGSDCFGGGGGGIVTQTNGVNNTTQTLLNLINSASFNGLTATFTNTSGGIVQAGFAGTLGNAGITNPQTTVNGQTCTLGGTCNIPFQISGVSNTSLTGLNFLNSSANAIGLAITPSNPGTNQVKWESTGTLLPVGGGTGKDSSGSTGVAQVTTGTWSFSTALANGTTATTQATNDATTKLATDAFVQNTTSLPNLATVGTIATGTWQSTAIGSTYGGTGINSSASTGVPHVTAGTWAVSTALPNGTTATTQSNGDSSTDLATDQFVINNTLTNPMTTLGDSMYGGASGVVTRLAGPTGPNGVPQTWIDVPAAGAAVAETWALSGVPLNAQTGTTYTFAATDRVSRVTFSNTSAIAVTLPQAGTTGFGSNFVTNACDIGAGTATITPTTSTVSYVNGQAYTSAAASVAITTGQCVTIYSDNTNYFATLYQSGTTGTAGGDLSGSYPNPTVAKVNGAAVPTSAAVLASNGSNQLTAATPHQVTLPLQCADTSASATTYTCTTTPSLGALTTGDTFILTGINQNNSGSSTLNIDAIGAKTIKKYQNSSNLAAGDLQLGGTTRLTYDGTNLEMDTIGQAPAGSGTVGSCATTGAVGIYGTAPSTTIGCGNADFTYATHTLTAGSLGLVDLSAEASGGLKVPVAAGATSAADGSIDYDSTNKNTHIRANGADAIAAAESTAIVVNTLAKSSSSTVGLLVGSSIVDNGTNVSTTEPYLSGTDGSTAGSFQASNSAASAHTIWGSGATTSNTIAGFATAPTTGDLVSCTTSSTTCTLTDSTVAASNVVTAASNASAAKQLCTASGASKTCSYIDYPQVFSIPACYNNNGTASGVDGTTATSVACTLRAGTNNKGAFYGPFTTSDSITWQIHIPADADLTNFPPYIDLDLASTDATNAHTIIMQESIACTKLDGSTTDDVAFNAARSLATITLNGNANRSWNTTITTNSTDMTGCAAPGLMWVKITRTTDTATNVELYGGSITIPRLLTVQAN